MSNFSVNGVSYNYSTFYSYFGAMNLSPKKIEYEFRKNHITQTGSPTDLRRLKDVLYKDYSAQVQEQIKNQEQQNVNPWSDVCRQIGLRETGDYETDREAFFSALDLLEQNAMDGQSMSYFASLRLDAKQAFGITPDNSNNVPTKTYHQYVKDILS